MCLFKTLFYYQKLFSLLWHGVKSGKEELRTVLLQSGFCVL